jgi:putative acetyltransferase
LTACPKPDAQGTAPKVSFAVLRSQVVRPGFGQKLSFEFSHVEIIKRSIDMESLQQRSSMKVEIRNELPTDIDAIDAVTTAAFLTAPHTDHTEQFIVKALRKAGKLAVSLVAEVEGNAVGHVAVSPVSISDGTSGWYGLGPISVLPAFQGQGIGSQLMRKALCVLREKGASGCVVLGEPSYYGRFGFQAMPGLRFSNVPPEYFQALPFGSSVPCGAVFYDDSFSAQA